MSDAQAEAALKQKITPLVLQGNYAAALRHVKVALRKHPKSFYVHYQYAKLLGDWSDILSSKQRAKKKRESILILQKLIRRRGQIPAEYLFGLHLNYYYQSEDFVGMWRFGRKFSKPRRNGHYAEGLAASYLAGQHFEKGSKRRARTWGLRSVRSWKTYGLQKERYYFAHYSFAKALAAAGLAGPALIALRRAARLAKRPVSDWEFRDVKAMIDSTA